ncbi:MAG: hypothetical protein WC665_05120 [Sulfurimonas sp.]|jgi:hypothetical protein
MKYYQQNNVNEDRNYAWQYFTTHAEQRLKTFHFFIIIMTLLIGTIFTLIKLENTFLIILMAALMSFFSFIFWKLDQRNRELINHAQCALKKIEKKSNIKLFLEESEKTEKQKEAKKDSSFFNRHYSYSDCFNSVFKLFGIGGITIIILILIYEYIVTKKDVIDPYYRLHEFAFSQNNLLSYELIPIFIFFWTLLHFFNKKNSYLQNFIIASLLSTIAISTIPIIKFDKLLSLKIDDVNLSYQSVNSKKELYQELKMLNKFILYFDKGEITIKENISKDNSFYLIHSSNINNIANLVQLLNKANTYYIKISAFASLEKVVNTNKVIDNYQLSIARASNTKEYILNLLINNHFPVNQVKFDIFGTSNQDIKNKFHDSNRKVEIEINIIK